MYENENNGTLAYALPFLLFPELIACCLQAQQSPPLEWHQCEPAELHGGMGRQIPSRLTPRRMGNPKKWKKNNGQDGEMERNTQV
jgi:hypothetical protein